jgi:hypothetical protein
MASLQNSEILTPNFAGGQCSGKGVSTLGGNEFYAVNSVILKPGGNGFRSREGNTALNASALQSAITGLGYLKTAAGNEYLVATAGANIYSDTNFSGVLTNVTGTVTVTADQNNHWTFFQSSGTLIAVGGAPDAPFKYTGSGNAALLGGTPPVGRYGFQYGNRTFIMSTVANASTIYWSVLLNPEDWSSTGSGSSTVEPDDGDILITAAPINLNTVILFKRNSIHLMTGRDAPFPIFPLFDNIGCVGRHACAVYEGLAYFITSEGKMAITDGNQIVKQVHLPDLDDVWKQVRAFRLPYIQGQIIKGPDFDWLVWSVTRSAANTNDYAIVWDLRNQCWLTCDHGFEGNAFTMTIDNVTYMGGFDGTIYRLFATTTYADASNSSTAVSWAVESDWITLERLLSLKQVNKASILHQTRATGTMTYSYAYDYNTTLTAKSWSIASATGAIWDTAQWDSSTWDGYNGHIKNITLFGRGNAFKWKLSGSSQVSYDVSLISHFGRNKSERVFDAVA